MTPKTCETCKFYIEITRASNWHAGGGYIVCENQVVTDAAMADASDDTGLDSWFAPPSTFGCNQWEAKK